MATRQGSLLLALLCAVCAAAVLVFALGRYKASVQQPTPQATVLVASTEIAKGTTGAQIAAEKLYRSTPVIASQVTPGAISNAAQLGSQTAVSAILPGQQLTATDFSTLAGIGLTLKPDQRAIEISVSGAAAAPDITSAGSRVDIYAAAPASSTGASASAGASSSSPTATTTPPATGAKVALLASDIDVLKPATSAPVTVGNQSVSGSTLVLAVDRRLVPTLIADSGSLYLALRPGNSGATAAVPATPITTSTKGAQP